MSGEENSELPAGPAPPRRPGWVSKFGVLLASAACAFGAAEALVRLVFHDEIHTETLRANEEAQQQLAGIVQSTTDPELLFTLKRGYYGNWIDVLVATHPTAPARISTFSPPPENPVVRIAFVGDSTPFGHGLQYESSYPFILRTLLEGTFGIPIELRNFSVPTYNSTQERVIFEKEVAPWKPDLIIYHYDHNDPDPPTEDPYTQLPPEFGDNILGSDFIKFARRRLRARKLESAQLRIKEADAQAGFIKGHRHSGPRYDTHLDEIRRMGGVVAGLGAPAVALMFDWGLETFDDPSQDPHYMTLHEPVVPHLARSGFVVFDMYPDYQSLMKQQGWSDLSPFYLRPNHKTHPNEAGHAFLADKLHNFILNNPALRAPLDRASGPAPDPGLAARVAAATSCYMGFLRLSQQRPGEAEPLLRQAVAYNPSDAGARAKLAKSLIRLGKVDEAIPHLEEVARLKPEYAFARMDLGDLYAHQGRKREAIIQYEAVLKIKSFDMFADKAASLMAALLAELATESAAAGNAVEAGRFLQRAATLYGIINQPEKVAEMRQLASKLNIPLSGQ